MSGTSYTDCFWSIEWKRLEDRDARWNAPRRAPERGWLKGEILDRLVSSIKDIVLLD